MRAALFSILFFVLSDSVQAQLKISFQLNLDSLVNEQLFSPEEGNRVFVRGSFNNWQGTDYELTRDTEGHLYTGTFFLEGYAGDTVFYKYVIEKGQDRFFWEDQPDPDNPDHGNRSLVLKDSYQLLPEAIFHYNEYFSYPVIFNKEKLQADFQQFRSILEETHPALYDYTEKTVLDSLFEHNYAAIKSDLDFNSFLMLMTEVIAQVGCGHSSLWIPGDYWIVTPRNLFSLKLQPSGEKFYVTGSFADVLKVPIGSEILSINGVPFEQIIQHLEYLTSADGMNQAFKRAKVAQDFSLKYAMAFGFPETFILQYL